MTDAYRTLLHYIVENDFSKARSIAKLIFSSNKTAKDQAFCEKVLAKMDEQEAKGIDIPYNLKNIIQTRCTAYDFRADRYYLTVRERAVLERIKKMYRTGNKMAELGLRYPNAVLLTGISGTGKTTFAQFVAHELGVPFLYVSITQLIDSLLGKTGQNMQLVFNFVATLDSAVVVLDEIDSVGTKRRDDSGSSGEMKRVLFSIMESLDKMKNNIILIAATNRPDSIDPALERRFPIKHEVTGLGCSEAVDFVERYLSNINMAWNGNATVFLSTLPANYNSTQASASEIGVDRIYTPAIITNRLNELIADAIVENPERPLVKL